MHSISFPRAARALLAVPVLLAACTPVRMALPAELAPVPELKVSGHNGFVLHQKIRFGDFETVDVHRGWTHVSGAPILSGSSERARQRFTFTLRGAAADEWTGQCESRASTSRGHIGPVATTSEDGNAFECTLTPAADTSAAWYLEMGSRGGRPIEGTLVRGAERFSVSPVTKLEGTRLCCMDAQGFTLAMGGRSVASVQLVSSGAVRLDPSLDAHQRALLAAALTALLLREDVGLDRAP
jgi:hypothetical protein